MPFIIYPQENNKLAVIFPCFGATKSVETEVQVPVLDKDGEPTGETTTQTRTEVVEMTIQEISEKDVPEGKPFAIVDDLSHVDDSYFDGFVYQDGVAVADIPACKMIHLNKFREARAPKLASLDIQYMRALEVGDTVKAAEIATQKQELRDVTKIPLPETLEEIKAVWPEILN